MTAAKKLNLISVDDYLAGELVSPIKHEYFGGKVYAMAEERNVHDLIAWNTLLAVGSRLRGKPFQPFNSGTKVRVRLPHQVHFYYADAMVVSRSNPHDDAFQDAPVVIFEVLSRSTRPIDEVEKKDVYLTIPSLQVYALIEQDGPAVVLHRRTDQGFVRELYEGLEAVLQLAEIDIELPLAEMYGSVDFYPEPADEDEG